MILARSFNSLHLEKDRPSPPTRWISLAGRTPPLTSAASALDYGLGHDPVDWNRLVRTNEPMGKADKIYSWDLSEIRSGPVTLRLRVNSTRGTACGAVLALELAGSYPHPHTYANRNPFANAYPNPTACSHAYHHAHSDPRNNHSRPLANSKDPRPAGCAVRRLKS